MFRFITLILSAILVVGSGIAFGNEEEPLKTTMESFKVIKTNGNENLIPAERAQPGDVIEYHIVQENVSEHQLSNIEVIGPVPQETFYLQETASMMKGVEVLFSYDNGVSYHKAPVTKTIKLEDGTEKEVEVKPEEYTDIKWLISEMKSGTSLKFKYRVKVK